MAAMTPGVRSLLVKASKKNVPDDPISIRNPAPRAKKTIDSHSR
jgi:hypothetical protein